MRASAPTSTIFNVHPERRSAGLGRHLLGRGHAAGRWSRRGAGLSLGVRWQHRVPSNSIGGWAVEIVEHGFEEIDGLDDPAKVASSGATRCVLAEAVRLIRRR